MPIDNRIAESPLSWAHLELIAGCVIPFLIFWWDTRRQNKRMHEQTQTQNWKMHTENQTRMKEIEVKLEPVWEWWKALKGGG